MTIYYARIELHGASEADYTELHERLERAGFERTVRSTSGTVYELPSGLYRYEGELDLKTAKDAAKGAADLTGRKSAVIVMESIAAKFEGLSKA